VGTTQTAPPRAATGGRPRSAAVVTLTSRSRAGGGGGTSHDLGAFRRRMPCFLLVRSGRLCLSPSPASQAIPCCCVCFDI